MICLFCKKSTEDSISEEHVIPESLGNNGNILPRGVVCDACNNYFSIKIEKPLLEMPYFVSVRHRNKIRNKKREVPKEKGVLLLGDGEEVEFYIDKGGSTSMIIKSDTASLNMLRQDSFSTIMLVNEEPPTDNPLFSKFLGKACIEAMAQVFKDDEERLREITMKQELDKLRNHVRFGEKPGFWPYHSRRVYAEDFIFLGENGAGEYCINHNYKFIQSLDQSILFVLELFGREYCIDIAEPSTERYTNWLAENNNARPLEGLIN